MTKLPKSSIFANSCVPVQATGASSTEAPIKSGRALCCETLSMEKTVPLVLDSLQKSVAALRAVLAKANDEAFMGALDEVARNAVRSGVIQHFEFTYELCWKSMKRWIEMHVSATAADGVTRRELFRQAAEQRLIDDVEQWMRYHAARNKTSHTYEPAVAESVYQVTSGFLRDAESLLQALAARND